VGSAFERLGERVDRFEAVEQRLIAPTAERVIRPVTVARRRTISATWLISKALDVVVGLLTHGYPTVLPFLSGRHAFEQRTWAESYRLLHAADRDAPLDAEDLERLAIAAYMVGRDDDCEAFTARAHQTFLDHGDSEAAARAAFWLGFALIRRGAFAPASGWFARAGRLLDEGQLDSVVRGYLLIPVGIKCIVQGDPAAAHTTFSEAAEIARRFADRDLASVACHGRGRALIRLGRIAESVALFDEAMASVIAGEVTPLVAGDVYCSVLEGCHETFDLRRAYEWTASLAEWCATQPGLVRYRGECLYYRAEVLQLRGQWDDAARDAQSACELLISQPGAGTAFYRHGDIYRLRGKFSKAEDAYARAHERGRKPQPGLSLLRLAQGQIDAAAASIRSVLLDAHGQFSRARLLPAAVEILLRAGDVAAARSSAAELSTIALAFGAPLLAAASEHATGAVLLAEGDIEGASRSLQRACDTWRELQMPYEEAHTCLLLAAVCENRGDQDGRRLEIETARRLFTQLQAEPCLARIAEPSERTVPQRIGSLSEREAQVLRLLAAGKTNRVIADELFISEKTVARHVSNIFDKLGVSNRTGATAWAFQHNLL
jgi:DNA-binding CsgD family transcriptional regulator